MKSIQLELKDSTRATYDTVQAYSVGEFFAVHRGDSRNWIVTHRLSGQRCNMHKLRQRKMAVHMAQSFEAVEGMDWRKDEPLAGLDERTLSILMMIRGATYS